MRTYRTLIILTILLVPLLLFTGCNTENEGVFQRIRESVPKVDVGYVDIIGINGNSLYAYTSKKGFMVYDVGDINNPVSLDITNVMQGLYTTDNNQSMETLYYAERGDGNPNPLYSFDLTDNNAVPVDTENIKVILQMRPRHNLMLIDDGGGDYSVTEVSDGSFTVGITNRFHETLHPTLISHDEARFIISGRDAGNENYVHFYVDSEEVSPEKELTSTTDESFDDHPLVAMMVQDTNIVVINSAGEVWKGDSGTPNDFAKTDTISTFPDRNPDSMPYPSFIFVSTMYVQISSNTFIAVQGDGTLYDSSVETVELIDDVLAALDVLRNMDVKSYLINPIVGDPKILYVGTMQNGIKVINLPGDFS